MRLLFDTNIVLDVLLDRAPFVDHSRPLWKAHDDGKLDGFITATSITNIFYIARRAQGIQKARGAVRLCLQTFQVISVDMPLLLSADALPGADYEDNVQIACAIEAQADAVVTRDKSHFGGSPIPVFSPQEILLQLP